jgi:phage terminase small subunit
VDLPSIDEIPPAPEWMPNGHAVREWERLTRVLVANRLLTEGGLSALGQMCALHGKIVQLYAAGESPNAALIAQYRALANDFGLTPVAQGKVRPHGDEPAKNEFTQNRKQAKPRA